MVLGKRNISQRGYVNAHASITNRSSFSPWETNFCKITVKGGPIQPACLFQYA
jgi:hypothetical protein